MARKGRKSKSPETPLPKQTAETEAAKAVEDRDTKGRFVRGNKGGPGNPHNKRTALFRKMFLDSVTDAKLAAIESIVYGAAMTGDLEACKFYMAMACGKPAEAESPDQALRDDEEQAIRDWIDDSLADSSSPTP